MTCIFLVSYLCSGRKIWLSRRKADDHERIVTEIFWKALSAVCLVSLFPLNWFWNRSYLDVFSLYTWPRRPFGRRPGIFETFAPQNLKIHRGKLRWNRPHSFTEDVLYIENINSYNKGLCHTLTLIFIGFHGLVWLRICAKYHSSVSNIFVTSIFQYFPINIHLEENLTFAQEDLKST